MLTFRIICLAKSIKLGGRCIAGLKVDGSGWLRPVSIQDGGKLIRCDYAYNDNDEARIFDIIEIDCLEHAPKCHQPENYIIGQKIWRFIGQPNRQELNTILGSEIAKNATSEGLFGDTSDKISHVLLKQNPVKSSLAYVKPKDIVWKVKEYLGKKNYRAKFLLNNNYYDLKITDPDWISQLDNVPLETGDYSSDQLINTLNLLDFTSDGFRLTISLGEPFTPTGYNQEYCFKLIAAVINVTPIINKLNSLP